LDTLAGRSKSPYGSEGWGFESLLDTSEQNTSEQNTSEQNSEQNTSERASERASKFAL
jgi:hypothetical protein